MNRFAYLGLALIAVVALWTAGWFFLAGQVRQNIELLGEADGVTAPRLACGRLDVSGFPFRFDAACGQAEIVSGDVTFAVPEIRASALVYRPTHLIASAQGPATITDAFTGARNGLAWDGLDASLRLDGWRIERLSLVGEGVSWTDTLFGEALIAASPHVELHLIDMPERFDADAGTAALAGYGQADAVDAPGLAIGQGNVSLEAELTGLPADIRLVGEADSLVRWQQAGGELRIVSLRASDGEDYLNSDGELALNATGHIEGQLHIASKGVVERLRGLFPEPYQGLVFGQPAADGSYANTVNFRGGVVSSGLVPAGMIPPLF